MPTSRHSAAADATVTCCVLASCLSCHPSRTSGPEPVSQNIATSRSASSPYSSLTYTNVMECFKITALMSASVPRSATFSSLLTLRPLDPVGSDFVLSPQICHIYVFPTTNLLSLDSVFCGFYVDGQRWLHYASEITQQRHYPF